MKKTIITLVTVISLISCNSNTESTETSVKTDSTVVAPVVADSSAVVEASVAIVDSVMPN